MRGDRLVSLLLALAGMSDGEPDPKVESIEYVDMAAARAARGVRLVVSGIVPSPWSQAAKALLHMKGIRALGVRTRRGDDELRAWTGAHNLPVLVVDDEPPRTGWTEIVAVTERLDGGRVPLVPTSPEARARMFGLVHEVASEGGLQWCGRLLMIHESLSSGGARSWPLPVAQYLAAKYGYAPERIAPARARMGETLDLLERQRARSAAEGHAYMLGAAPTALDVYVATFLNALVPLSEADCPSMRPELRAAFAWLAGEVGPAVPAGLAALRRLMYERHLPWPIVL